MAEMLGLPFLNVTVKKDKHFHRQLFGQNELYSETEAGELVEFLANQTDVRGKPLEENIYPVIVFLDEIDKTLNARDPDPSVKQFFLRVLNNDMKHEIHCKGMADLSVPVDFLLIILGANEQVYMPDLSSSVEGEAKPRNVDDALMNRLHVLPFNPYSPEQKEKIANGMLEEILATFKRTTLSEQAMARVKEVVKKDSFPGVRVLRTSLTSIVVEEIAREDGWDIPVEEVAVVAGGATK
jgi:hypothetical protein